jgi:hypothetical protein
MLVWCSSIVSVHTYTAADQQAGKWEKIRRIEGKLMGWFVCCWMVDEARGVESQ